MNGSVLPALKQKKLTVLLPTAFCGQRSVIARISVSAKRWQVLCRIDTAAGAIGFRTLPLRRDDVHRAQESVVRAEVGGATTARTAYTMPRALAQGTFMRRRSAGRCRTDRSSGGGRTCAP